MRIAVMGAGGVGAYFGGRLARAGQDVTFIARGEHLRALQERGLEVRSTLGDFTLATVTATDEPAEVGPVDLVLVCVKAYDTEVAARAIRPMVGPETAVLSLQNGVDNHERLAAVLGSEHVLGGLCYISSFIAAPGVIHHVSQFARVVFGELDGRITPRAEGIRQAFADAGVEVTLSTDIIKDIWMKFTFIAAQGGMTSVTRSSIGLIRQVPATWEMYVDAVREIHQVALARGVNLDADAVEKTLAFVQGLAPDIKSSMLADVKQGRPLEIETFSGTVVRLGRELGVPTPVHRAIYAILKLEDERNRRRRAES